MKTALLLVSCVVLYFGLSEGHQYGLFGQERRGGSHFMGPKHNRPIRFRFNKIRQKLFRNNRRMFGNRRRPIMVGQVETGRFPTINITSISGHHTFRKLRACKQQCRDDCIGINSCRQLCQGKCESARVPSVCKLNCFANDCINSTCTTCYKSCIGGRNECREEHCSQDCRGRRFFKRAQCKRCMADHCSNSTSNSEEEESDVEENQNIVNIENSIMKKLEDVEERIRPIFASFINDDNNGFVQTMLDTVERIEDE